MVLVNFMVCCVCGKNSDDVKEYTSTLYNAALPYCFNCITAGYEPYKDLISCGWEFNKFSKSYQQKILLPTLAFYKKSIEQFNEDVENFKTGSK